MNKIGEILYEGGGLDIYQEEGAFFYDHDFRTDDDDPGHHRSNLFDSLEELLATLPKGLFYRPVGSNAENPLDEITEENLARWKAADDLLKKSYEDDIRNYGTTDFLEIRRIIDERSTRRSDDE